jgi:hypothetical protein
MKRKSQSPKRIPLATHSWEFAVIEPPRVRTAGDLPPLVEGLADWLDVAMRIIDSGKHRKLLIALLTDLQCALFSIRDVLGKGEMPKSLYFKNDDVLVELRSLVRVLDMEEVEGSEATLLLDCAIRAAEMRQSTEAEA